MADFKESGLIKNPFRMYRYEAVGAYRDFLFSDDSNIQLRKSMEEDGYDDVTTIVTLQDLPANIAERYAPFQRKISEEEYTGMIGSVCLDDIRKTQGWAGKKTPDALRLLSKLNSSAARCRKITKSDFTNTLVTPFMVKNPAIVRIEGIKSLDVNFVFHYNRSFNAIEVNISEVSMPGFDDSGREQRYHESLIYVPKDVMTYYYGIDFVQGSQKDAVFRMLQQEYLPTPAMVFDASLYGTLRGKIRKVTYSTSREG
jgi:hypothetical protein